MFYLIECDSDNSYCILEEFSIIYDPDHPPTVGDKVVFYWKDDKCMGNVVDISDDAEELKALAKKLKIKTKNSDTNNSPLPSKRLHKPKKSWSFEEEKNPPLKKIKVGIKKSTDKESSTNLNHQVKSLIDQNKSPFDKKKKATVSKNSENSPSKEELMLIIKEQEKLLTSLKDSKLHTKNINISDDDDDDNTDKNKNKYQEKRKEKNDNDILSKAVVEVDSDDGDKNPQGYAIELPVVNDKNIENVSPQLYGRNSGVPMILLKDNIYCKKTAFDDAVDFSRKSATSFLRRLMNGVFKPSAILNCTFSGRPPNAQGKTRQSEEVEPLDRTAKKVILEYCAEYARKNNWPASSDKELRKAISQWVGEIKRENKKNLQSQK